MNNMTIKKTILLAACAFSSFMVNAQDPISRVVSTIIDNNPELRSERELIVAQSLDDSDANALSDPQVDFSRVWGAHGIGNKLQLDVSQSFDWPGLYRARGKAAAAGRNAAELLAQWTELQLSLDAKMLLVELVYVRKQLQLASEMQNTITRLGEAMETAYKNGEVNELAVRKIAIERYKQASDIDDIISRESQICESLQSLSPDVRLDLSDIIDYPFEKVLTLEQYLNQIDELDPEVGAARASIDMERLNAKVAQQSRFPGFSIGYQHQAEMGDFFNGFTVGVALPVFQNRKARIAALNRKAAAEEGVTAILAKKRAETQTAICELQLWGKQVEDFSKIFGDNVYFTLLEKAYKGGEMSLHEYLSEMQYYNEVAQTYLDAEYNYFQALVSLNQYNFSAIK